MKKKTVTFLNLSFILIAILCIIIFITQLVILNSMSDVAIGELGTHYMTGISEQVSSHFGTIIELRLLQVESLVDAVPPKTVTDTEMQYMRVMLRQYARSMDFDYLALYRKDGNDYKFDMICGADFLPDVPDDLYESVQEGKYNVCAGKDKNDVPLALFGVPAAYTMSDRGTSIALIAGFPTESLGDTLESNIHSDNSLNYIIIRSDGSLVLRSQDITEDNYFDRIKNSYESFNGKTPEQYAEELQKAMTAGEEYNSSVTIDGERWNVHCASLPNSRWYLLVKTSHGLVDDTINTLQRNWFITALVGCILIVCALIAVFIIYYLSTKKQMQALDAARETAERSNNAKNEFLSNMSHDIRTPMNGIMGMTNIAIGNIDNPPKVRACLNKIYVSSRHLLGLISDMLDMAKVESGNLTLNNEPTSLREIMENVTTVIEPLIHEKNQSFKIYMHNIYHENVCSDRIRLSQILLNVLGNAVKFTQEGGAIRLDLFETASPKGDGYIRSTLRIRDNGIGMSQEFKDKIFEPFAREDAARVEKSSGAGMGMTITKRIVDAMDGYIEIDSEKGKGSTFNVVIDMQILADKQSDQTFPSCSALVLDEDSESAEITAEILQSIGLTTQSCNNFNQALALIKEKKDQRAPYSLMLIDWNTQDVDKLEAIKKLTQKVGKSLPVVLLTDGDVVELEANKDALCVNGFIKRPLFRSSAYNVLLSAIKTRSKVKLEEEQALDQANKQTESADFTGKRALIAEDNDLNWEIASELLDELGMKSERAENGQICIDMFDSSTPNYYDIVLMDLRMPIMMGFEAAKGIRNLERDDAKNIPIIAVSADTFEDDVQKCIDCGMNAHTAKPLDLDKLIGLLKQYIV